MIVLRRIGARLVVGSIEVETVDTSGNAVAHIFYLLESIEVLYHIVSKKSRYFLKKCK